ncbi:MAG: DUF4233 domain-containing protein [Sporichthyaceae bacterium]|nr:DUF4233 domain-containing protein [Sporichthyaceae bacterium]
MKGIAAAVLVFEGMVVFFATLVALDLSEVDDTTLWQVGGSLAGACVIAAALLRRPWGYAVGSALQVAVIAAGLVVPAMFFLGLLFAGLWFLALYLGRKVARLQREPPGQQSPPGPQPGR